MTPRKLRSHESILMDHSVGNRHRSPILSPTSSSTEMVPQRLYKEEDDDFLSTIPLHRLDKEEENVTSKNGTNRQSRVYANEEERNKENAVPSSSMMPSQYTSSRPFEERLHPSFPKFPPLGPSSHSNHRNNSSSQRPPRFFPTSYTTPSLSSSSKSINTNHHSPTYQKHKSSMPKQFKPRLLPPSSGEQEAIPFPILTPPSPHSSRNKRSFPDHNTSEHSRHSSSATLASTSSQPKISSHLNSNSNKHGLSKSPYETSKSPYETSPVRKSHRNEFYPFHHTTHPKQQTASLSSSSKVGRRGSSESLMIPMLGCLSKSSTSPSSYPLQQQKQPLEAKKKSQPSSSLSSPLQDAHLFSPNKTTRFGPRRSKAELPPTPHRELDTAPTSLFSSYETRDMSIFRDDEPHERRNNQDNCTFDESDSPRTLLFPPETTDSNTTQNNKLPQLSQNATKSPQYPSSPTTNNNNSSSSLLHSSSSMSLTTTPRVQIAEDLFGSSSFSTSTTPRLYEKSPHYVKSPHWTKSVSVNPFSPVPEEYLCGNSMSENGSMTTEGLYGGHRNLYGNKPRMEHTPPSPAKTCASVRKKRMTQSRIPVHSSSSSTKQQSQSNQQNWCLFRPTEYNDGANDTASTEEERKLVPSPTNMSDDDDDNKKMKETHHYTTKVSPTDVINASFSPRTTAPPASTTTFAISENREDDHEDEDAISTTTMETTSTHLEHNHKSFYPHYRHQHPPSIQRRKSPRRRRQIVPSTTTHSAATTMNSLNYNLSLPSPSSSPSSSPRRPFPYHTSPPQCRPTLPRLSSSPSPFSSSSPPPFFSPSSRSSPPPLPSSSPPSSSHTTTPSSRFHDDFQEVGILGTGSFGSVYKCISRLDGCLYAVKVVKREARGEIARHHMLKEVYALAALCNQSDGREFHIVRYHQAWMEENRLYIQTELCTSTLCNEISRGCFHQKRKNGDNVDGSDSNERHFKLLREILLALELIHGNDMVHLDIKPDNIFVKNDQFKLGDFGLAHKAAPGDDVEEGDARYMSKELLSGELDDLTKCDIFSLGATMYEVCLGRSLPPNGQEWQDIRAGLLSPLHETKAELRNIIVDMMHPKPDQRPSATELLKRRQLLSKEQQELIVEKNKVKEVSMALAAQQKKLEKLFGTEMPRRRPKMVRSASSVL
uniref:Protein kinase domain-containing protein n=1 Tax=Ditylum brightwellii TaxID=49249 RepID=A0A7S1YQJ0_9STRA|mmetsp:Transcript_13768/g.20576  ORF Transcript_13768/g.20576 Transcript_13768/m.20576 type:complete len:1161 (+) Transcript_13768:623-4105(+)